MSALSADKYAAVRLVALGTDSKRGLTKFMSRLKSGLEPFYTPEPAGRRITCHPKAFRRHFLICVRWPWPFIFLNWWLIHRFVFLETFA